MPSKPPLSFYNAAKTRKQKDPKKSVRKKGRLDLKGSGGDEKLERHPKTPSVPKPVPESKPLCDIDNATLKSNLSRLQMKANPHLAALVAAVTGRNSVLSDDDYVLPVGYTITVSDKLNLASVGINFH